MIIQQSLSSFHYITLFTHCQTPIFPSTMFAKKLQPFFILSLLAISSSAIGVEHQTVPSLCQTTTISHQNDHSTSNSLPHMDWVVWSPTTSSGSDATPVIVVSTSVHLLSSSVGKLSSSVRVYTSEPTRTWSDWVQTSFATSTRSAHTWSSPIWSPTSEALMAKSTTKYESQSPTASKTGTTTSCTTHSSSHSRVTIPVASTDEAAWSTWINHDDLDSDSSSHSGAAEDPSDDWTAWSSNTASSAKSTSSDSKSSLDGIVGGSAGSLAGELGGIL